MADDSIHEGLSRVISLLTSAVTNTGLYSSTHPQVAQYVEKAYAGLVDMLRQKPEITVLLIGSDLVTDNRPLAASGAASYVSNFSRILRKKAIERMTFTTGLTKPELQSLINDLASPDTVSVRSTLSVKLGKVELRTKKDDEGNTDVLSALAEGVAVSVPGASPDMLQELLSLTATELDALKELYLSAKKHKKIDVRGVDEMVKGFIHGFRREINPLSLLASLKSVHEYTFTHVTNVCILAMGQAETLGFNGENLHQIGVASLLHDVGKVFIPEEILNKPGKLSQDERKIVETHTVKGARYLMGIEGIPKLAILSAMEHHLKYDGSGYPSIKGGWRPNIVSQLISIADVFDAMRSKRSYQGAIPMQKIAEVLNGGKGTSFNPQLVDHFFRLIRYQAK
ncbi:MAG TPA: HD domain-containing phosphohydrolase [Nitrospirota bacterium]|nr:HD domain-containing phosphohydrolase [Nitrospirota bacterium]